MTAVLFEVWRIGQNMPGWAERHGVAVLPLGSDDEPQIVVRAVLHTETNTWGLKAVWLSSRRGYVLKPTDSHLLSDALPSASIINETGDVALDDRDLLLARMAAEGRNEP